jgi:hypothetical protein
VIVVTTTASTWTRSVFQQIFPILAVCLPLAVCLCPYDGLTYPFFGVITNGYTQRISFLKEFGYVLCAPWVETTLLRSLIGDVLCSMPRAFADLQYTLCLYVGGISLSLFTDTQDPFATTAHTCSGSNSNIYFTVECMLQLLPFAIRFFQCVRLIVDTRATKYAHMFNACKYVLSFSLALVSKLMQAHGAQRGTHDAYYNNIRVWWFVLGVSTTLFVVYWDLVMDWGLFQNVRCCCGSSNTTLSYNTTTNAITHTATNRAACCHRKWLLRDIILYRASTYYAAMVVNTLFRLGWSIVISPGQPFVSQHFVLLLGAIECLRRGIWLLIRVEYEQVKIIEEMIKSQRR